MLEYYAMEREHAVGEGLHHDQPHRRCRPDGGEQHQGDAQDDGVGHQQAAITDPREHAADEGLGAPWHGPLRA